MNPPRVKIENSFESHTHTHVYVKNVKNLENVAKNNKENVTSHPISQRYVLFTFLGASLMAQ